MFEIVILHFPTGIRVLQPKSNGTIKFKLYFFFFVIVGTESFEMEINIYFLFVCDLNWFFFQKWSFFMVLLVQKVNLCVPLLLPRSKCVQLYFYIIIYWEEQSAFTLSLSLPLFRIFHVIQKLTPCWFFLGAYILHQKAMFHVVCLFPFIVFYFVSHFHCSGHFFIIPFLYFSSFGELKNID